MSYELMMIMFGLGVGLLVGATGVGGGSIMTPLLVVVAGAIVQGNGGPADRLLGTDSLVRNTPFPALTADRSAGASVLRLDRGPYFTLLRECPAFTIGLLELGAARRQNS